MARMWAFNRSHRFRQQQNTQRKNHSVESSTEHTSKILNRNMFGAWLLTMHWVTHSVNGLAYIYKLLHENGVEAILIAAVRASATEATNEQKGFLIHVHLNCTTLVLISLTLFHVGQLHSYTNTHTHETSCTTRYFNQSLCYIHPLKWDSSAN